MKKLILGVLMLMAATVFIGCSTKKEIKETEKESEKIETEEELKIIGEEMEDSYCVKIKNSTGKDIIGIAIKSTEEVFEGNMLSESDSFKNGEERKLFYKSTSSDEKTKTNNEKVLTQGYEIELTFADQSKNVLHGFPFDDIEKGEICMEDELVFITYKSLSTDDEISTKEAEFAIKTSEETQEEETYSYEEDWSYNSYDNNTSGEIVVPEAPAVTEQTSAPEPTPTPEVPVQETEACLGDDALSW